MDTPTGMLPVFGAAPSLTGVPGRIVTGLSNARPGRRITSTGSPEKKGSKLSGSSKSMGVRGVVAVGMHGLGPVVGESVAGGARMLGTCAAGAEGTAGLRGEAAVP